MDLDIHGEYKHLIRASKRLIIAIVKNNSSTDTVNEVVHAKNDLFSEIMAIEQRIKKKGLQ